MLVDIKQAIEEFLEYVKKFDQNEFQIKRKVSHSIRTMKLSDEIATSLNLSKEEIDIAALIGLLHDIGRFKQYTEYKTFRDAISIDHGDLGAEILKEENFIRKFIKTSKYDEIIFEAIKNHNKIEIQENLDEKQLVFCKIIRDADKLDILYQATNPSWQAEIEQMEKEKLEEKDLLPYREERIMNKEGFSDFDRKLNKILIRIAFVYDMNFLETFKILKEENYINEIIDRFNFEDKKTKEYMEEIRERANIYIEKKLEQQKG